MTTVVLPQRMPSRQNRLRARILVLSLSVVLGVIGLALYQAMLAERAARNQVTRTIAIMNLLNMSLQAGVNAETGQRGFLLTEDAAYLGPYEEGSRDWLTTIDALELTLADTATPSQLEHLAAMRELAERRLDYLRQTVALVQSGQRDAAIDFVRSDAGKQVMDAYRSTVARLHAEEGDILNGALARSRAVEARTIPIFIGLALWIICLVVAGLWFERRAADAEAKARDVEMIRESQQRAELLARELNHRVKNLFAVILSIVNLSSRGESDVRKVISAIRSRIQALSLAHAVSQGQLDSPIVDLKQVLTATLEPYATHEGRVRITGPDVSIPVKSVTPLGLVAHELATNAAKYGGLSVAEGKVSVDWTVEDGPDGGIVKVVWQEQGGPASDTGSSEGFGSIMMKTAAAQLLGTLSREFTPDGLRATVVFPVAQS